MQGLQKLLKTEEKKISVDTNYFETYSNRREKTTQKQRNDIDFLWLASKSHMNRHSYSRSFYLLSLQCLRCSSQPLYSFLCTCTQAKVTVAGKQTLKVFFPFTFRAVVFHMKFNLPLYFSYALTSGPSIP